MPSSRFVSMPEIVPNPSYQKRSFVIKMQEMGFENDHANAVMEVLESDFSASELDISARRVRRETMPRDAGAPAHPGMHTMAGRFQLRAAVLPRARHERAHHLPRLAQ